MLVYCPGLGGQVWGVGFGQRAGFHTGHVQLPCPQQHVRTAAGWSVEVGHHTCLKQRSMQTLISLDCSNMLLGAEH